MYEHASDDNDFACPMNYKQRHITQLIIPLLPRQ